ncbi:oxidoreductase [bacterium]|nr:MAG: oxidoreductase [bacterium]
MNWSHEQLKLAKKYKSIDEVPEELLRYKCHDCLLVFDMPVCPQCGSEKLSKMCPLDNCHCGHDVMQMIDYCPLCGEAVCPECGTHDVAQISRITGYLQDVAGWNAAKKQELKDRHRTIVKGGDEYNGDE